MGKSGWIKHKHCKRLNISGHAHYLTFSCFHNKPFLSSRRSASWLIDAITDARERRPFDLWAFVIMPEHVHLLVRPHPGVKISEILSAVKQPVAKRALLWVREQRPEALRVMADTQASGRVSHRFWQRGGGYDRNLWSPRDVHEKVRYIHANPVRRGLVLRPQDWPWSSWRAWHEGVEEPLRIDRQSVPRL